MVFHAKQTALLLFALCVFASSALAAGVDVPNGSTMAVATGTLEVTGDISFAGTLSATSGFISLTGNWTNSGTFTANSSTVAFKGAANQTMTHLSQDFYNLVLNNNGGASDVIPSAGTVNVNNNLTVTDGVLKLDTNNTALTVDAATSVAAAGAITCGTATTTFTGAATVAGTFTGSSNTKTFG
ncbi:MAG: hypothetical protein PHQ23_12335, partial [Candidatus Wallbacteria bacterium]|nr:hypothetical protein [Candidatus Wallbacteria bacterium]